MNRFAIELKYDGTNYHGWQSQTNVITVQEVLQGAIEKISRQTITITGCGRTDTGVHASHFVANFDLNEPVSEDFLFRLNNLLPADISVDSIYKVPDNFNARFDAVSRTYKYFVTRSKNPFNRDYAYLFYRDLDVEKMNAACKIIESKTEFGAFCKSKAQNKTNICDISFAFWEEEADQLVFHIKANRFLRNMVRAIVGTLIDIGENKISLEEFVTIIDSQNRQLAGYSVPARGLFLQEVLYVRDSWKLISKR